MTLEYKPEDTEEGIVITKHQMKKYLDLLMDQSTNKNRQRFEMAKAVASGFIYSRDWTYEDIAGSIVRYADAIIAELERKK